MQKAKELTSASNVDLGLIQSIDYSWHEIDIVSRPLRDFDEGCYCDAAIQTNSTYDVDIDPEDIKLSDTVTVVWEIC